MSYTLPISEEIVSENLLTKLATNPVCHHSTSIGGQGDFAGSRKKRTLKCMSQAFLEAKSMPSEQLE